MAKKTAFTDRGWRRAFKLNAQFETMLLLAILFLALLLIAQLIS